MVERKEIWPAGFQQLFVISREYRHAPPSPFAHHLWIVSKVQRIGKPTELKLVSALSCLLVRGAPRVGGGVVQAVEGNPNLGILLRVVLRPEELAGCCMCQKLVVCHQVALAPIRVLLPWSKCPGAIAKVCSNPWLVQRDPVRHTMSEGGEHSLGKLHEILNDMGAFPSAILLLTPLRGVPVEEGDNWCDSGPDRLIDNTRIEVQPLLVDLPLLRDDPAPGDAETEAGVPAASTSS
mmetsp:Transcript_2672/g.7574  ORF Transcript_2672/g.7574 Transcript_2672/m.7574 type:complete len:236 (-) Transcript_2672:374-1081(-)